MEAEREGTWGYTDLQVRHAILAVIGKRAELKSDLSPGDLNTVSVLSREGSCFSLGYVVQGA